MLIFKKLIFALPFFLSFAWFISQVSPFLQNPTLILSLEMNIAVQIILLIVSLLLTGFFFAVFATLAQTWKYTVPVAFAVPFSALAFLPNETGVIIAGGAIFTFLTVNFFLSRKLATYLTFQTSSIVVPSIKQTATLLILVLSLTFYFQTSAEIQAKGFQLPSSLVDTALKFIPAQNLPQETSSLPQISPEQIALLEQNPDLLKQYGLDPSILQTLKNQGTQSKPLSTEDLIKPMIESQFQAMIKPYQNFIPAILAVLFYFSLSALSSLLSMLLPFLTWLTFWILEKVEFVKFEIEQREVRKLVV